MLGFLLVQTVCFITTVGVFGYTVLKERGKRHVSKKGNLYHQ